MKSFYKKVFQVKLDKLYHPHEGISIESRILFAECQKMKIPEDKWKEFVFNEMTNLNKYLNILKTKRKFQKQTSKRLTMEIVQKEE
jgi:hypothetical protein